MAKLSDGQFSGPIVPGRLQTTTPDDAFAKAISFFKKALGGGKLAGLGISLYGVVDSEKAQFLGSTPVDWTNKFDVWDLIKQHGGAKIVSEDRLKCHTDAAAAVIAEYVWGAAQPIQRGKDAERKNIVYFKILDGIGSGVILAGRLLQGSLHPEMGHIPVRRAKDDPYFGGCPIHNDVQRALPPLGP